MNIQKTGSNDHLRFFAHLLSVSLLSFVAFVNPGDVVMKKLSNNYTLNKHLSTASRETTHYLISPSPVKIVVTQEEKREIPAKTENAHIDDVTGHDFSIVNEIDPFLLSVSADMNQWNEEIADNLVPAITTEERDYSIPEKAEPTLPAAAAIEQLPFVPQSSFSYFFMEDTSKSRAKNKVRSQTYEERLAKESLAKAQKAVNKIDWKRIEKQLKSQGRVDILKIRKEIQRSLEELNWQQINQEVKEHINKESIENVKSSLKAEYNEMLKYKARQEQLQKIQNELKQQQEKYTKEAEINVIEIQKELGKMRITVHI